MTKKRIMLGAAAAGFVALLIAALTPTSPAAAVTPQQALAAALAGQYNCTLTDQANGFTLTCTTPGGSPSPSISASPSSTPTASASASPSSSPSTLPPSASTSPSSTASSPPGPLVNCQANPIGCGFPDAANTGTTSAPLVTLNGNQTFSTANQTIANTTINGCVEVRAANVTFRNVRFNAAGCFWGVRNFSTGLQVIDSTIDCARTNGTAFGSSDLSLLRVEILRCENGLNVAGRVNVTDSWIHDMNLNAGGAHTDGAQFNQGASDITFRHNTINVGPQNGATSAIIMWDEGGAQNARVSIDGNLLAGGTYTLYCGREGAVDNVRITNNRFGTYEYKYADACNSGEVWFGNVRDSTGVIINAT